MRSGQSGADGAGAHSGEPRRSRAQLSLYRRRLADRFVRLSSLQRRLSQRLAQMPSGVGVAASVLLLAASLGYGAVAGQHVPDLLSWLKDARDATANSLGFRIAAVSLTGSKEVSREEILTAAGVTGRASLMFLDADAARARLMANPWIADAAVLKLYPDRLQITVREREAYALWQKDGHVNVIAADGTVLEPYVEARYINLPLVVGHGAEKRAKDFLAIIERYPDLRSVLRASVLVAERRWNLRLDSGIDVRLPETGVEEALNRLVQLDRDKKLLSRDITAVDLRLPDRVSVRLSDGAAQARNDALKDKKKKKGGDA